MRLPAKSRCRLLDRPLIEAAHAAAPSPLNDRAEPTPAQRGSRNFAHGHIKIAGLDISIQHPQGAPDTLGHWRCQYCMVANTPETTTAT